MRKFSDLPIQHELVLLLSPGTQQVCESSVVYDIGKGAIHAFPHHGEGRFGLAALPAFAVMRTFDEAQHFAHGDRVRRPCEQVPTLGASSRFYESALL